LKTAPRPAWNCTCRVSAKDVLCCRGRKQGAREQHNLQPEPHLESSYQPLLVLLYDLILPGSMRPLSCRRMWRQTQLRTLNSISQQCRQAESPWHLRLYRVDSHWVVKDASGLSFRRHMQGIRSSPSAAIYRVREPTGLPRISLCDFVGILKECSPASSRPQLRHCEGTQLLPQWRVESSAA